MTRRQKDPLRPFTDNKRQLLAQISRGQREPVSHVERARLLLAVAAGQRYTAAGHAVGRRFNHEGLAALTPRHGGDVALQYGPAEREHILAELHRTPDRTLRVSRRVSGIAMATP